MTIRVTPIQKEGPSENAGPAGQEDGGMQYYQCAGLLHIRKYRYNPLSVTLLESQKNMIIFVVLC